MWRLTFNAAMPIRAYKFLQKQFALKTLYERRFKITKLTELNDIFDLAPYDLSDPTISNALTETRLELGKAAGLICFSAKCSDPVIWAHYSGNHTGICLGFDIQIAEERVRRVRYIDTTLSFPRDRQPDEAVVRDMLYTKFRHWEYEDELRLWAHVTEEEDGICYHDIQDGETRLAEVILGAACATPKKAIERAVNVGGFKDVRIRKMRPARRGFCMEDDPDWAGS
jgi:hypothetical protein